MGNRLSQTITIDQTPLEFDYLYDDANRLMEVNQVAYSWDDNGNLLDDGVNQYSYDVANRLIGFDDGETEYGFAYNGLGERMQQTVDSETTTYTLDLNRGLTQVLNDGTSAYVYGHELLSLQTDTLEQYPLRDALGSIRQLTEQSSAITLFNTYEPYGARQSTSGEAELAYGFAGEWTDETGLQYLRARYYAPWQGRFISQDSFGGLVGLPFSLHKYAYGYANPIRYIDPSGYISQEEAATADRIYNYLLSTYNVRIQRDWGVRHIQLPGMLFAVLGCTFPVWHEGNWRSLDELRYVQKAVQDVARALGGAGKFRSAIASRTVNIARYKSFFGSNSFAPDPIVGARILADIVLLDRNMNNQGVATYTIAHELGHVWDLRHYGRLSRGLTNVVATRKEICNYGGSGIPACYYVVTSREDHDLAPGTGEVGRTKYALTNSLEDWAESFVAYVYPNSSFWGDESIRLEPGGLRYSYIRAQIEAIR
ncbi:MAG: hypothetical protein KIS80_01800 [Anaerolineales bacterium]|nr:hypothetical protein [Anaerolineales bacterium]